MAALMLCIGFISGCHKTRETPAIKNVLLITLDTTRADAIGIYGNTQIHTPTMDAMARNGHRYTSCYTHAPITLPSHSSILTGKIPTRHGVRNNINYALDPATVRLPQVLKRNGFQTGAFVSSFILDSRFGLDHGFQIYEDDIVHYSENRKPKEIVTRRAAVTIDKLMHWLEQSGDAPFFSWLHLYDAHYPYQPPQPFSQAYPENPYYGEIAYMDYELGRLMTYLKDRGIYDHTLVIITADHGESFNQHGEMSHGFFCYGATTHVPLILSQPLYGKPGETFSHLVQSTDLVPSILDALGLPPLTDIDGLSLNNRSRREIYAEAIIPQEDFYLAPVHALKDEHYSFYYSSTKELYDLKKDPDETQNLINTHPKLANNYLKKMETLLATAHSNSGSVSLDQESIELLRSLGYIAEGGNFSVKESDPYKYRSPYQSIKTYRQLQSLRHYEETFPFKTMEGLRKLIEEDRKQIILYRDLGRLATFAGFEQEALDNLKIAALLKPDDPRLHTFYGLGLQRFKHFEDSVREFDVALKLSPNHHIARYNLALSLVELNQIDKALRTLKKAHEDNPQDALTLNNLAWLYLQHKKDPETAWLYIQKASEINGAHPLISANKALIDNVRNTQK